MSIVCGCCVLCGLRSLRRADHSSRGVLQTVMCLSVIVNPRHWPHGGLSNHKKVVIYEANVFISIKS